MSTKLTTLSKMPLTVQLDRAASWIMSALMVHLQARGLSDVSEPQIRLLGNLDCGATYASEVARRMSVTRQAVYRTVGEMQALGLLTLERDATSKNRKLVVMTEEGERLALAARAALAEVEKQLADRIGTVQLRRLREVLATDWGAPDDRAVKIDRRIDG